MIETSLQVIKNTGGNITSGDKVIFNEINNLNGNIYYDSSTGIITIYDNGIYAISWFVAIQTSQSSNGTLFSLKDGNGIDIIGNIPVKTGSCVGFAIVDAYPGMNLYLENNSGNIIYYASALPTKANLVVTKITTTQNLPIIMPPFIDLSLEGIQTVNPGEYLSFSQVNLSNNMSYNSGTGTISIYEPGVYKVTLFFYSDIPSIMASYSGNDRIFDFSSDFEYKSISFLFQGTGSIGFYNSNGITYNFGLAGNNQNGGLTISKVSEFFIWSIYKNYKSFIHSINIWEHKIIMRGGKKWMKYMLMH